MKLGLFSDPHSADRAVPGSGRRYELSYGKIRAAMDAFRAAEVDLVVCLGDLVDECETEEENAAHLDRLAAMIRSYGLPFHCVMGNHDYQNFTAEEFYRRLGLPPCAASAPYILRTEGKTLIFTDTNYADDGTVYRRDAFDWTNAFLPPEQMTVLRETLADPGTKDVYVFFHQNIDPGTEAHHIIRNAAEIRELLASSGKVKAVYQGHYHPGHKSVTDGIPYHTLSAMCEGEANPFRIDEI